MGFSRITKRASVAPLIPQSNAPPPAVLTMGISPAAAVATWRLAESKMFQCYTYWPVQEVTFHSEVFGKDQVFHANHYDLTEPPKLQPGQSLAAVILVIPTIKDVARMCKKLKPILSNSSLVLVDICGGLAPVQRLVKTNLGSSFQVSGMISDIDAEFVSKGTSNWQVLHRKASTVPPAATTASQSLITLEPCNPLLKSILSLEEAWAVTGLSSTHLKSSAMFAEFQWNRCITTVVFEVLTVVMDSPQPASIDQSVVAKPLVKGLIAEMTVVAAACGVTGLQKSQMLANGSRLARQAPADFSDPSFSRTYYEVYNRLPVPLDFLVLLPILLSDELPKGGQTPYLECIYAIMSRILQLNDGEYTSPLFERVGSGAGGNAGMDPQIIAAFEARERDLMARENQVATLDKSRSVEMEQAQLQLHQYQQELQKLQQQLAEEKTEHERSKQDIEPRYRSQIDELQAQLQQQHYQIQQQQQEIQQRSVQQQQRDVDNNPSEPSDVTERLEKLRIREQELSQREERLRRDQEIMAQQQQLANGSAAAVTSPSSSSMAQPPSTPGGTTYSRFDPYAPQPVQQQLPQQYQSIDPTDPNQSYAPQDSSYNSIDSRSIRGVAPTNGMYAGAIPPSSSRNQMMVPPPVANTPYFQPNGFQPNYMPQAQVPMQLQPQPYTPQQPSQQYRRRPSRRASVGDETDMMSVASGRRRQQSLPATQSAIFSQNFQLDGVMNATTDRYHFVSRGRTKQRDPKLSSDEDAYHRSRKYIHGGSTSGNYPNLSNGGVPEVNTARRKSSYTPNGGIPQSNSASLAPRQMGTHSSIKNIVTSPSVPQSLIPPTVVPSGQANDFAGFNFGASHESIDPLDSNHQMPTSLDPAARGDGYGSFPGSNNSSSMESNHASDRSDTRTPPTPQGSLDPLKKNNIESAHEETEKSKNWGKRLFRMG